jgi:hypothetical protein
MDDDEKKVENTDEEQVVEDTDADTKDVEKSVSDDYSDISGRLGKMEDAIKRMTGTIEAMQKAQTNMVSMGAVIREDGNTNDDDSTDDSFVPLEELDFSI